MKPTGKTLSAAQVSQLERKAARRAAREAKRAKQRAQNLGRAKTMRAARIAEPIVATASAEGLPAAIYVGCSGWFYWRWKRCFYPEALSTREWFAFYARRFKTVELNAPFYSWPSVRDRAHLASTS